MGKLKIGRGRRGHGPEANGSVHGGFYDYEAQNTWGPYSDDGDFRENGRRRVRLPELDPRRTRILTRVGPLVLLAAAAFGFGVWLSGTSARAERALVRRYVQAWSHKDFASMYGMLSDASRGRIGAAKFQSAYDKYYSLATVSSLAVGHGLHISHNVASVPLIVRTHVFGTLHQTLRLNLADDSHVGYASYELFPGLHSHEKLTRHLRMGARGTLEAADGTPLAQGPSRSSPIPNVANQIVGSLGPIPAAQKSEYTDLGYPSGTQVGQNGLEQVFQKQLAGKPGGTLDAGSRMLAAVAPTPGKTVKTTINPKLEQAALTALGSNYAGMTVMNSKTGAIEAAVGLAYSDLQPPGSTFKIVTAAAALQSGVATPQSKFPYEQKTSVGGFVMQNDAGESCGGTLINAFAVSCDTTFAPLSIKIGAKRIEDTAKRFGYNEPTGIPNALESTLPPGSMSSDTAVGSTGIGQGQLQATTLEVADTGATIANAGKRPLPTLSYNAKPRYVRATTPHVAAEIQKMMQAVVSYGTGTPAKLPGVQLAGKTGTAELANTAGKQNDKKNTDAWFVGYVPGSKQPLVASALFPANGMGADSAAPAVSSVLKSAL
ncbi:MAG: hypothetical protein J2O48_03065 [Solirubrobacterales bacterium]|nr:hypothetical protein [Solirubrobacterales bacterium]